MYAAAQREVFVEDPKEEDLYPIGCVVRVRQVLKISDNTVKVLVDGLYRAKAGAVSFGAFLSAGITRLEDKPIKNRPVYLESLIRRIRTQFEKYVEVYSNMAPDVVMQVAVSDDVGKLADFIASSVPAPYDDKQYILEQTDPVRRAKILIEMLDKEREIGEIDRRIGKKPKRLLTKISANTIFASR